MKKQQSGFTLIELIMVIVILGILSVFAVPKFADLSGEAELAAIQGAEASVRSASAIAHSAALVANTANGADVTLEDTAVTIQHGYPDIADICAAAGIGNGFTCTAVTPATTPPTTTVNLDSNTSCTFTYQEASATTAPVIGNASC